MNYLKLTLLALTFFALPLAPLAVSAQGSQEAAQRAACLGAGGTWDSAAGTCDDGSGGVSDILTAVANVLLFIVGAVAVIMLIIGGFRYVASAGDSGAIESAKNTILYAIIGLIIAFTAYAAVNFIVNRLG